MKSKTDNLSYDAIIQKGVDTLNGMGMAQYLTDEDKATLLQISVYAVEVLRRKEGALVFMVDVKGNGRAEIIASGNPDIVPALMYAAQPAADAMFKKPETSIIQ